MDESNASPAHIEVASNFRQIFATFLPCLSAFMIHSSGLIRRGRAMLFLAPNEGGKSTVLVLAGPGGRLNDDQVIIRKKTGKVIEAYGTPFGSLTDGPLSAPVAGLFFLEKASAFELGPIHPSDLLKCLWDEHQRYIYFLPKDLKVRTFHLLTDLCRQARTFRMKFPKDFIDWDAIDRALDS